LLFVFGAREFPADQFTVYKRAGSTTLCPDPSENLIFFNPLQGKGPEANLPR
jgi:hypothetical protein